VKKYLHTPVLTEEVIAHLRCSEGGLFVDATVGEGGHSLGILEASPQTTVIGIDLPQILRKMGIEGIDGLLFDLGISHFHFMKEERGFGIHHNGPLDMRMDTRGTVTAADIVNRFPLEELETIVGRYGEERWTKRIVKAIGKERQRGEIRTTGELAEIVSRAIPRQHHPRRIHPATKTFMALRIAVNEELTKLEQVLREAPLLLKQGRRIGVIAFHSLEDRIVKESFKRMERTCICPPTLPQCVCGGREQVLQVITKRPLTPRSEELRDNPRARSAKLRVAQRV
jgi:16S rRNA (cytosine1402-N4)-methyltransferase